MYRIRLWASFGGRRQICAALLFCHFSADLAHETDNVLLALDSKPISRRSHPGAHLLKDAIGLVEAEGFAHEFAHGAVFLLGQGLGLLVERRGEGDGDDFGGSHTA